jgi:hypothetical protein
MAGERVAVLEMGACVGERHLARGAVVGAEGEGISVEGDDAGAGAVAYAER